VFPGLQQCVDLANKETRPFEENNADNDMVTFQEIDIVGLIDQPVPIFRYSFELLSDLRMRGTISSLVPTHELREQLRSDPCVFARKRKPLAIRLLRHPQI